MIPSGNLTKNWIGHRPIYNIKLKFDLDGGTVVEVWNYWNLNLLGPIAISISDIREWLVNTGKLLTLEEYESQKELHAQLCYGIGGSRSKSHGWHYSITDHPFTNKLSFASQLKQLMSTTC